MSGVVMIVGLGILCAVLVAIFFKLSDKPEQEGDFGHFALQILFLGFIIGSLVLVGKTAYDYKDNCDWVIQNTTVSGNFTSYNHSYVCSTNTNETARTFYDLTVWILRITILYLFLYFSYKVFKWFKFKKRGGEQ